MRPPEMEMGSVHSLHEHHDMPLPTPPDEKRAATVKRLSYVVGYLYSIFLIILAGRVYLNTAVVGEPWAAILTIYITVSGLIILCILIVDIKLFTRRIRKQVEALRSKAEEQELEYLTQFDDNAEELGKETATGFISQPTTELENIEHNYCFVQGRHSGSVYLKFGAAGVTVTCTLFCNCVNMSTAFALGHFVYTLLLVVTVHWSITISNVQCINGTEYVASLLQCLYCFVQLFFIFNYSNLIIAKQTTTMRIAFLHMMAGNVCLWISAVTTETKLAYKSYEWLQIQKNTTNITDTTGATAAFKWDESCRPSAVVIRIFDDYSEYLYPFTVEFNILVVGIFFMVWRNIGKCRHSAEEVQDFHHSLYSQSNISGDVNSPHALDIHISCRNSLCGLFSSLIVIVVLIVAIIIGFVLGNINNEAFQHTGQVFTDSTYLAFHTTMLITTGVAFYKMRSLDINKNPVPWLDDVLLYICAPAFFLESILTVVPTILTLSIVKLLDTIMMSLQMIIQIVFIVDGLRKCSNSRKMRRKKPGREFVLFLLVTNVAMWLMYTFSYKSPESKDVRYVYYGKELWILIDHHCTPIIMFFRFHSSVCIADIWSYAFKPGIKDH